MKIVGTHAPYGQRRMWRLDSRLERWRFGRSLGAREVRARLALSTSTRR
jgi:hypothetical protein